MHVFAQLVCAHGLLQSSVYLFYDPDVKVLAPGQLSALIEVAWVLGASEVQPALHYYYMGFYVHSCHKMRYKADYGPADLLCHETKQCVATVLLQFVLAPTKRLHQLSAWLHAWWCLVSCVMVLSTSLSFVSWYLTCTHTQ